MKRMKTNIQLLVAVSVWSMLAPVQAADDKPILSDPKKKAAYSAGVSIGTSWKTQDIDLDPDTVLQGLKDALAGKALLSQQEVSETLRAYNMDLRVKQEEKRKQLGEKNKLEGEKFLAENKTKPGIITLPSGLQYKVIKEGAGASPQVNDTFTANYRGTLIDGTEFDKSAPDKPLTRAVNQVIPGWTEGLQKMKAGSKYQFFIPSNLAYGERGQGATIGPNATLLFDVELLSIQPAPPLPPTNQANQVTSDIIKVPSAEGLKKGEKIEIIKPDQIEKKEPQAKP
jgi:FKBP-type peptidyl-prolyl cis-trans isomerase FklB